jgi:hypothetical protein
MKNGLIGGALMLATLAGAAVGYWLGLQQRPSREGRHPRGVRADHISQHAVRAERVGQRPARRRVVACC